MKRLVAILVIAALMTSCGGGGGDARQSASPPPASPPPVAFNLSNAGTVATLVVASGEAPLLLADEAALALRKFDGVTLYQAADNCTSGSARYLLTDNDQDGRLSVGDQVRTDYSRCLSASTGAFVFGDLYVTLDAIDDSRGTDDVRYRATMDASSVTLQAAGGLVTVDGEISFEFERGIYQSRLAVSGDVFVTFTAPSNGASVTADWTAMNVSKLEDYETASYEASMTGTWQSNILAGGAATIVTTTPIAGPLNIWPTSGQVEITSNDGTGARIRADGPGPGDYAIVAVDENGDGLFSELTETRDWENILAGYLPWFELSSPDEFAIRTYEPNDFQILTWRPHERGDDGFELTDPNPTIRVLTSRAIDPATVPSNLRLVSSQTSWPFTDVFVDVDVEVRGAMLLFRPLQQLAFDTPYRFPEQPFEISDENGNLLLVSNLDAQIQVVDNLAAATTPEEAFGFPGDQILLSSDDTAATVGGVDSIAWSQVLGAPAQLSDTNQAVATITLPAIAQTELLRVQLQVTNSFGELDYAKTDITLFPSVNDIDLVYARALASDSSSQDWYLTSANGTQQYTYNGSNRLVFAHDTNYVNAELGISFRENWQISLEAPATSNIATGSYNDISRTAASDTEAGLSIIGDPDCSLSLAQFDVLEFTTDAEGRPDSVAIDFVQECDGSSDIQLVEGFLRLRSSIPVESPN